jgi:hypothetical protein
MEEAKVRISVGLVDEFRQAGRQVVPPDNLQAHAQQSVDQITADEAGGTRDEDALQFSNTRSGRQVLHSCLGEKTNFPTRMGAIHFLIRNPRNMKSLVLGIHVNSRSVKPALSAASRMSR